MDVEEELEEDDFEIEFEETDDDNFELDDLSDEE